jgi:hypothetical protein
MAPADQYFGHYRLSVLGIANTIKDADARIAETGQAPSMIDGPLAFVTDALHAWQARYPHDPWLPKDIYALEVVYLHAGSSDAIRLASKTESWLMHDYPESAYAGRGADALADATGDVDPDAPPIQTADEHADPWERFAALRAPIPASH